MKQALWAALLLSLSMVCACEARAMDDDVEISGLVIDRTLTRFGKEFSFYYS